MFGLIIIGLAFLVLLLASLNDLKTREVPDYLSYSLLAIAVILRILWFISDRNINILIWAPIAFSILFLFSYLMYRAGQWGGGDVKVMMGLSILLSWFPNGGTLPFFVDFFLNSLIIGAFYGLAAVSIIGIINWEKLKEHLLTIDYIILPAIAIAVIIIFKVIPLIFAILVSLLVIAIGMFRYFKIIESNFLRKEADVESLTEGDWLLHDVKIDGKTVLKKRDVGLVVDDLKKLRTLKNSGKLSKVWIKVGIPFVPAFLISLMATIAFGNILLRIMSYGLSTI